MVECQFAIRMCAQYMREPTVGAWKIMRHVVSYLQGVKYHAVVFEEPEPGHGIVVIRPDVFFVVECGPPSFCCRFGVGSGEGCGVRFQLFHSLAGVNITSASTQAGVHHKRVCVNKS